jgi:hypothetical protein
LKEFGFEEKDEVQEKGDEKVELELELELEEEVVVVVDVYEDEGEEVVADEGKFQ